MPSATEPNLPGPSRRLRQLCIGCARWNRKLHFYSGLFLLFFLWLFAFSGLLLNHPTWRFDESWNNRKEINYEREITPFESDALSDLGLAREIMRQLRIKGDILWTTTRPNPNQFDFQVRRPGHFFFINADLGRKRLTVRQSDVNLWGVIKVLHTFTGVSLDDPRQKRDWPLTYLWAYSMDGVAAGLVFMILSSLYMCFELHSKRLPGSVVLGLGSLACGLFCFGLRWLF
jgi:hypothetical protein